MCKRSVRDFLAFPPNTSLTEFQHSALGILEPAPCQTIGKGSGAAVTGQAQDFQFWSVGSSLEETSTHSSPQQTIVSLPVI